MKRRRSPLERWEPEEKKLLDEGKKMNVAC
jgi:hypothetical protein